MPNARALPLSPASHAPTQSVSRLPTRADGIEARERLLLAALALFAEKGYARTSTREIARNAGANVGAIAYYFGDKEGLYAAAFFEPLGDMEQDRLVLEQSAGLPLRTVLGIFFRQFLEPLKRGEVVRHCVHLHFREMLEPDGRWAPHMREQVKASHEALAAVLARHLGTGCIDDDLHRLVIGVCGLAVQLFITYDMIEAIEPSLLDGDAAIDTWAERLVDHAVAMVSAEAVRRRKLSIKRPIDRSLASAAVRKTKPRAKPARPAIASTAP